MMLSDAILFSSYIGTDKFDGDDTFFGAVNGHMFEIGYFSLSELQELRGPFGLPVERDLYFKPTPLSQIRKQYA